MPPPELNDPAIIPSGVLSVIGANYLPHLPRPALVARTYWDLPLPSYVQVSSLSFAADFDVTGLSYPGLPHSASHKRKREFLAGRFCAFDALRRSGCLNPGTLAPSPERLPSWPSGWLGSISHTNDRAVAVVAPATSCACLGIDIEGILTDRIAREVSCQVLTSTEVCTGGDMDPRLLTTVVFSAKESLYKALYPHLRSFLDFDVARLTKISSTNMTLTLTRSLGGAWVEGTEFPVRYTIQDECVCTVVCIPREPLAEPLHGSGEMRSDRVEEGRPRQRTHHE